MAESTKHYRMSNMNPLKRFKHKCESRVRVKVVVCSATFNNISVVSWWSVLLVEETEKP
jgi:hypothetical protein